MKKEWRALIAVILVAALLPAAEEWISVKVTSHQIYPGGLVILTLEKNPVPSLTRLTHCIARAQVEYQKGKIIAVYDSTATLYPKESELHLDGPQMLGQCKESGITSISALLEATKEWTIQPKS